MPEPPSYARRFFTKAYRETADFSRHKLVVGPSVAITAIIVRLFLLRFHQLKLTWADAWNDLLIIVGSYTTVLIMSFVVNLFRAPVLLVQDRANEITSLTGKLKLVESSQGQKQIKLRFATLMERAVEIRERLERAKNGAEVAELVAEREDWVRETILVLKDSGELTDAVAFSQVGKLPQAAEQVQEWRHIIGEPRRRELIRLAMYCKKLDQIMDNRRL
jgi:hypothetical protein